MTSTGDSGAAFAKPSATIIVLRDTRAAPELLLVKRRAGDAFGDSYAFPGGIVEDHDHCEEVGAGLTSAAADAVLGISGGGIGYFCAGIRELFEETRILLAKDKTDSWADCTPGIDALRRQVDSGTLLWSDFLQQENLRMAFDALHYFAHWETPYDAPKRWTTRFFVARLPGGQRACHDGTETTECRWLSAAEALRLGTTGDIRLPYPTQKILEDLTGYRSVESIVRWTERQRQAGVSMIRLRTVRS